MKRFSKFFLGVLLLTVATVSWAACPEGTKQTYKGCEPIVSESEPAQDCGQLRQGTVRYYECLRRRGNQPEENESEQSVPKRATYFIEVKSEPVEAAVFLDNIFEGFTPLVRSLGGRVVIRVEKDGYRTAVREFNITKDMTITFQLEGERVSGPEPGAPCFGTDYKGETTQGVWERQEVDNVDDGVILRCRVGQQPDTTEYEYPKSKKEVPEEGGPTGIGTEPETDQPKSKKEVPEDGGATTPDESVFEDCDDLICGKWRITKPGWFIVVEIVSASGGEWEFESRISDPGNIGGGYRTGMIKSRFNKVRDGLYIGESMWRHPIFGGRYAPYALDLLSENSYEAGIRVSVPIEGGPVSYGSRIGEHPEETAKVSGSGTGFFVSSDGLIITNHHVIGDANEISVRVPSGEIYNAEVVSQSPSTDLALLQIPHQTKHYLSFEQPGAVEIGDDVFTLGFPISALLGKEVKYSEGVINSLSGIQGDATFFQISVPIQPGNSGGPLINEDGNVVGIVTATAAVEAFYKATGSLPQNVNWAVKGAYASLLLPPGIEKAERTTDNPITNAKHSVVFIETK